MFRYAIFDFDGTLADTGAGVFASVQYALRSMGEPELDSETLKYFIGPPLETSFSVKCGLDSERCHEAVENTANTIRQKVYMNSNSSRARFRPCAN